MHLALDSIISLIKRLNLYLFHNSLLNFASDSNLWLTVNYEIFFKLHRISPSNYIDLFAHSLVKHGNFSDDRTNRVVLFSVEVASVKGARLSAVTAGTVIRMTDHGVAAPRFSHAEQLFCGF